MSVTSSEIQLGEHLTPWQQRLAKLLVSHFKAIFSERLGQMDLIFHHIKTEPGKMMQEPIRLPAKKMEALVKEELKMRKLRSSWNLKVPGAVQYFWSLNPIPQSSSA